MENLIDDPGTKDFPFPIYHFVTRHWGAPGSSAAWRTGLRLQIGNASGLINEKWQMANDIWNI